MKRAICLSGGGGKGAYQIGVWKALRKLRIKYDIITGTSVGALNGALMTQNTYYRSVNLWKNMNFNLIFESPLKEEYTLYDVLKMYGKSILETGGMDVTNLETLITKTINEKKIISSPIDFGIMTVNLSTRKPLAIKKNDIDPILLKDYLMASATCFPAFKIKKIKEESYVDGGYFDNVPINLAIEMGAEEVIAVDLGGMEIKRKVKNDKIPIIYIKPQNDIGNFLVFDKELSNRNIKYGYNDTMKVFHKLEGNRLTFKNNSINKLCKTFSIRTYEILKDGLNNNDDSIISDIVTVSIYRRFLKKETREVAFEEILEHLSVNLNVDETKIYNSYTIKKEILHRANTFKEDKDIKKLIKNLDIESLFNTASIILYIEKQFSIKLSTKTKKELRHLATLFPKEYLDAALLYALRGN